MNSYTSTYITLSGGQARPVLCTYCIATSLIERLAEQNILEHPEFDGKTQFDRKTQQDLTTL